MTRSDGDIRTLSFGTKKDVMIAVAFLVGIMVGTIIKTEKAYGLRESDSIQVERRITMSLQDAELQKHKDHKPKNEKTQVKSFTELLIESGSDKYDRHHFEQYYTKWLQPFRHNRDLKFLEIGARDGKSMQLWNNYFDDTTDNIEGTAENNENSNDKKLILGLAYGAFTQSVVNTTSSLDKVQIFFGDQSKKQTMDALVQKGPWDIVIDDGSHIPQHVIFSLFSLWNSVKPGGYYIIEDIETSYWPHNKAIYGYRVNSTGIGVSAQFSVVSKLQEIEQVLVRHQIGARELSIMPGDHDICSVEWGMNIVAIQKCQSGESIIKPPYQKPTYNKDIMLNYIAKAKASNPY